MRTLNDLSIFITYHKESKIDYYVLEPTDSVQSNTTLINEIEKSFSEWLSMNNSLPKITGDCLVYKHGHGVRNVFKSKGDHYLYDSAEVLTHWKE